MMVNGKIALNPYTTDIKLMDLVNIGEKIIANKEGEEFYLTAGKEYELLNHDGDCIMVENNLGRREYFSVDYFRKTY